MAVFIFILLLYAHFDVYNIMATTNTACSVSDQDNSTNGLEPHTKRIRASVLCPHCDQYISKSDIDLPSMTDVVRIGLRLLK